MKKMILMVMMKMVIVMMMIANIRFQIIQMERQISFVITFTNKYFGGYFGKNYLLIYLYYLFQKNWSKDIFKAPLICYYLFKIT